MEPGGEGGCWFLYFAYGSNLLRERLLLRNPSAALSAPARLQVRQRAGGRGEPGVPAGSPEFLRGARVSPRSRLSPRLLRSGAAARPSVRPSRGGGPSTGPRQGRGARFCTMVLTDRTRSDGCDLKRKEFHLSTRSDFFTLREAGH